MKSTDKNAMALYVRVVECGSFSKAAQREGVPVSTVSRKVAELEQSLGVRLLERSTRQLRMTEMGQLYFEHCRRGLAEFDAADAALTDRQARLSGRLRISVPPTMSDLVVLPLVSAFQAQHPEVTVHCLVTERFIDPIGDGIDLALRVGTLDDSSLVAVSVGKHCPRLLASPAYLAAAGEIRHPSQLAAHVQLAFSRWERPIRWSLRCGSETFQLEPAPRLVINDYAGVLHGLLQDAGISELPTFIGAAAQRERRLLEVLPEWQFEAQPVALAYPSGRHLSPLVRAFKAHCQQHLAAHPLA